MAKQRLDTLPVTRGLADNKSKAHYVTKPIDIDQLKGVIDRILS